jgi:hypothetical protein
VIDRPVEVVAAVPTAPTTITLYFRHVYIPGDREPDPMYALSNSGRWGTEWTLHTADAPHVAWSEYCRSAALDLGRADPTGGVGITRENLPYLARIAVGDLLPPRSLYSLTFRFQTLADLTGASTVRALSDRGFDESNFYADDFGDCPALANAGEEAGWDALVAPSAAWRPDGLCIAVFRRGSEQLRRRSRIVVSGRPTVAVAYATTYRASERPAWLGPS